MRSARAIALNRAYVQAIRSSAGMGNLLAKQPTIDQAVGFKMEKLSMYE